MRLHLAFYAAWPGPALAPALAWPGPVPAAVLGLLPDLADVPKLQSNFHFSAHVFRLNSHFGHNFAVFTFALALNCNFWRAHAPVHCLPSLSPPLSLSLLPLSLLALLYALLLLPLLPLL